jgi:hypothetical protein
VGVLLRFAAMRVPTERRASRRLTLQKAAEAARAAAAAAMAGAEPAVHSESGDDDEAEEASALTEGAADSLPQAEALSAAAAPPPQPAPGLASLGGGAGLLPLVVQAVPTAAPADGGAADFHHDYHVDSQGRRSTNTNFKKGHVGDVVAKWDTLVDGSGKTYYQNRLTGEKSWTKPDWGVVLMQTKAAERDRTNSASDMRKASQSLKAIDVKGMREKFVASQRRGSDSAHPMSAKELAAATGLSLAAAQATVNVADADGDGQLSMEELEAAAARLAGTAGDGGSAEEGGGGEEEEEASSSSEEEGGFKGGPVMFESSDALRQGIRKASGALAERQAERAALRPPVDNHPAGADTPESSQYDVSVMGQPLLGLTGGGSAAALKSAAARKGSSGFRNRKGSKAKANGSKHGPEEIF